MRAYLCVDGGAEGARAAAASAARIQPLAA